MSYSFSQSFEGPLSQHEFDDPLHEYLKWTLERAAGVYTLSIRSTRGAPNPSPGVQRLFSRPVHFSGQCVFKSRGPLGELKERKISSVKAHPACTAELGSPPDSLISSLSVRVDCLHFVEQPLKRRREEEDEEKTPATKSPKTE